MRYAAVRPAGIPMHCAFAPRLTPWAQFSHRTPGEEIHRRPVETLEIVPWVRPTVIVTGRGLSCLCGTCRALRRNERLEEPLECAFGGAVRERYR
jgi:hypothetical protein